MVPQLPQDPQPDSEQILLSELDQIANDLDTLVPESKPNQAPETDVLMKNYTGQFQKLVAKMKRIANKLRTNTESQLPSDQEGHSTIPAEITGKFETDNADR